MANHFKSAISSIRSGLRWMLLPILTVVDLLTNIYDTLYMRWVRQRVHRREQQVTASLLRVQPLGRSMASINQMSSEQPPVLNLGTDFSLSPSSSTPSACSSPLLCLPPEIRSLIWQYAVGDRFIFAPCRCIPGRRIHYPHAWPLSSHIPVRRTIESPGAEYVMDSDDLLTMERRPIGITRSIWCHERSYVASSRWSQPREVERPCVRKRCHWSGLALVLMCKKMRDECLAVLMGSNTFHFCSIEEFAWFRCRSTRSSMMHHVRYLYLHLIPISTDCVTMYAGRNALVSSQALAPGTEFPRPSTVLDHNTWRALWNVVATELPNLLELEVQITPYQYDLACFRAEWLDDLWILKKKKKEGDLEKTGLRKVNIHVNVPHSPMEFIITWESSRNWSAPRDRELWKYIGPKVEELHRGLVE